MSSANGKRAGEEHGDGGDLAKRPRIEGLDEACVQVIRCLAADQVQKASGAYNL